MVPSGRILTLPPVVTPYPSLVEEVTSHQPGGVTYLSGLETLDTPVTIPCDSTRGRSVYPLSPRPRVRRTKPLHLVVPVLLLRCGCHLKERSRVSLKTSRREEFGSRRILRVDIDRNLGNPVNEVGTKGTPLFLIHEP